MGVRTRSRLQQLSLRVRVFLFFALVAAGSLAALTFALVVGYRRLADPQAMDEMVVVGVVAGFCIFVLVAGVWLLFDDHVAKPIERLAGNMRARTHTDIRADIDPSMGRYLGDLAPAAATVTRYLSETRSALAEAVSRETARLAAEKERLETLLADVPVGVVLCSARHQVVFYNGQAAANLDQTAGGSTTPGLYRPIFDYLNEEVLRANYERLLAAGQPDALCEFQCALAHNERYIAVKMRLLADNVSPREAGNGPGYVLTLGEPYLLSQGPEPRTSRLPFHRAPRTAVYDFELLSKARTAEIYACRLSDLVFVVFDTETTGLLPNKDDEIVQIAAVRIVNGKRIDNEIFDAYVNPGRAIPAVATQIHGITETAVARAPQIDVVGKRFHHFAKDAVLVAHNAPFDMAFLRKHEARIGCSFENPVLDTILLSAIVYGQSESHSLDALAHRLGIHIPDSARHTALGDTIATADAFLKLLPALQDRGLETFGQLLEAMRRHSRLLKDVNR